MNRKNLFNGLLIFVLILLGSMNNYSAFAQKKFDNSVFNFGAKIGLNALSSTSYDVYFEDTKLGNKSQKNKYGYLINLFARINLDKFFMQPEIEWNQYRQECAFALPISLEENIYQAKETLELNENAFNIYVLTGYNIVKNGPYLINSYIGGAVRINYKTEYKFQNNFSFTDSNLDYNFSGILGASLNIGIIHFDIRYHLNFPNTDINLSKIENLTGNYQGISFKKNENILSFSCGVMF